MKVVSMTCTCSACPSQWDGLTDDDRQVCVRYRWGWLTVSVSEPGDKEEFAAVHGREVFMAQIGSGYDGILSYEELKKAAAGHIEWPEESGIGEGRIYAIGV